MNVSITYAVVIYFIFQFTFSSAVKKKKFKVTTAILADRIASHIDTVTRLTRELPMGEGHTLVQEEEALNSCIRQFVKLIYADDYFDKDIVKVQSLGPQPKFLEIELSDEKVKTAKLNFDWTDKDIEEWIFLRLCTYQHWNHLFTYKNHYVGMKK